MLEQLNDDGYYKKNDKNPENPTKKRIRKLIKDYDHCLIDKEIGNLCDFTPKGSNFIGYQKPIKMHKYKTPYVIRTVYI